MNARTFTILPRKAASIRWSDIEALPIYAATALGLTFMLLALTEMPSSLSSNVIKVVGIIGSLALRNAWIRMDGAGSEM